MAEKTLLLAHGGGGTLMRDLIEQVIVPHLPRPDALGLEDSAVLPAVRERIAFTTDSYVVRPLFFPGGDIGRLAVCGTVNDLAMAGAVPKYVSLAFIAEEGLPVAELERILASIQFAAAEAKLEIVTGDTKVVNRGAADGLFVNTAGIGFVPEGRAVGPSHVVPGDVVIVNGPIGDHGIAIVSEREGLKFHTPVKSDVAPLGAVVMRLFDVADVHCLKDPTRGGVAAALNEIATTAGLGICLNEEHLPVRPEVQGACDMLGFDPLYVANEGKVLVVCPPDSERPILQILNEHPLGPAAVIGQVTASNPGMVTMSTRAGGTRIVDWPYGEQLPRIC